MMSILHLRTLTDFFTVLTVPKVLNGEPFMCLLGFSLSTLIILQLSTFFVKHFNKVLQIFFKIFTTPKFRLKSAKNNTFFAFFYFLYANKIAINAISSLCEIKPSIWYKFFPQYSRITVPSI